MLRKASAGRGKMGWIVRNVMVWVRLARIFSYNLIICCIRTVLSESNDRVFKIFKKVAYNEVAMVRNLSD